jgi:hypothetical protein
MKNNAEARLFLQELLEWQNDTSYSSKDICTIYRCSASYNGSLQIPAFLQTLSLRLTEETVNLRTHHWPRSYCQQFWIHCQQTAVQVGLPSYPVDKSQKSWYQRRLLGHFWGLDVLDQGQAPWPQRLSQYELLEVKWNTNLMQNCVGSISAESHYMFRAQAPIIRSI